MDADGDQSYLFLIAMSSAVIFNYSLTHDANSLLVALAFIVTMFFAFAWPASVLAILLLGIYQSFWGDDTLGTRNSWLGFASIVLTILFMYLGLAIT